MFRGLAALAVLINHYRQLFYIEYPDLTVKSPLAGLLYVVTGFGYEAVMVFFVLSGFFVGGSVLAALHRWNWNNYLVNRLSRLYLVLLPALLLTSVCDYLAMRQPGGQAYFNRFSLSHHSLIVFLANLAFLQTLATPHFGSNAPLWSLAYEFWYYLLFPSLAIALFSPARLLHRAFCFLAALILLFLLPSRLVILFPVWLLGAALRVLPAVDVGRTLQRSGQFIAAGIFFGVLMLARVHRLPYPWSDMILGFAFSLWLYSLVKLRPSVPNSGSQEVPLFMNGWYERLAESLSKCSYSVYAVHFPLLVLIRVLVGTPLLAPAAGNLVVAAVSCAGLFFSGLMFSRLTEARTAAVRTRVLALFAGPANTSLSVGAVSSTGVR